MHTLKRISFLAMFVAMPSMAQIYLDGFVEGQVVEDDTNAPLANVIVTTVWVGTAGSDQNCLHGASAFTDKDGRYRIPEWRHPARLGRYTQISTVVTAYLPGYVQRSGKDSEMILLARDHSDKKRRLDTLDRLRADAACASLPRGRRILMPLQSALLEEAKTLVNETSEPGVLESFRFDAEVQQYGEGTAKQRQEERRRATK